MSAHETTNTDELPLRQCWELLRTAVVGRLAVVVDGQPDIFPVNYVVDHGSVVFRTAAGTKLAATKGREVAFEADGYDTSEGTAWSVVVKGRATAIREMNESISALSLPLLPWQEGNKPYFIRVDYTSVTGRRLRVAGGFRQQPDDREDDAEQGDQPRPAADH
ncbi:pyridoxamine 5'-phosphate oxidase family protein [Lapillicoccus sp.]|uniref:pyridoxamine 5'-phosphate oxidase family protein n=1 Tax=Lapillicoccus sp. TaxID=1909287 RepID=UPI00326373DF